MAFSRKDFETVAEVLRDKMAGKSKNTDTVEMCESIADSLADVFAKSNPRFDRTRFMDACGL